MKKETKKPFTVLKKGVLTCMLGATMVAGSAMMVGCDGDQSMNLNGDTWYSGKDVPTTSAYAGKVGDFYIDTDDYDLYEMKEAGWTKIGNIYQVTGKDGVDGTKWYSGLVDPLDTMEVNLGDFYLNTVTFELFKKDATEWTSLGRIKGEDGAPATAKEVEMRIEGGVIQWKLEGEQSWNNLIDTATLTGAPGKNAQIRVDGGYIQWKLDGEASWNNLIAVNSLKGADGKKVILEVNAENELQFKYEGESTWTTLLDLDTLKGADGKSAELRVEGEYIQWRQEEGTWTNLIALESLKGGVGASGREVDFRVEDGNLEWAYKVTTGEPTWTTLFALDDVKGATGAQVESVREVKDDKWGISSHFEFTLNDANSTVISTTPVSNLLENYYYDAETGEDVLALIELGAENIKLDNDVTVSDAIVLKNELSFDLDNNKLTYACEAPILVENGLTLEFFDGQMDFDSKNTIESMIKVYRGSTLILKEVEYICEGTCVTVWGDAAKLEVKDSKLVGGTYAVSTNANQVENYGVIIDLIDSEFDVTGYNQDESSPYCFDDCAILINVPSEINIKGCKITGDRQAIVARGGNILLEDCEITLTGNHGKYNVTNQTKYDNASWGEGNEVPMSALVVGNNALNAYQYATNLTLKNNKIVSKRAFGKQIFAVGNAGENIGVTINADASMMQDGLNNVYFGENVQINFEVADFDTLGNLLEVAEHMNMKLTLSQDLVFNYGSMDYMTHLMLQDYISSGLIDLNGYELVYDYDQNEENAQVYNSKQLELALKAKFSHIMLMGKEYYDEHGYIVIPQTYNVAKPINFDWDCYIDLGNNTLNITEAGQSVITRNLTLDNGYVEGTTEFVTQSMFKVCANARLDVRDTIIISNGSGILVTGENATFVMERCALQANTWGIATNAKDETCHGVNITISDSYIITASKEENPDLDNTAVMLNVPGYLYMNRSFVLGDRQALLVRGGNAIIENSMIGLTGRYENLTQYTDENWKDGNEVPSAVIVVGNRVGSDNHGYGKSAMLTLNNTDFGGCDITKVNYTYDQFGRINGAEYITDDEQGMMIAAPYIYAYRTALEGQEPYEVVVNNNYKFNIAEFVPTGVIFENGAVYNYTFVEDNQGGQENQGQGISANYSVAPNLSARITVEAVLVNPPVEDGGEPQFNTIGGQSTEVLDNEMGFSGTLTEIPGVAHTVDGAFYYQITITNNSQKELNLEAYFNGNCSNYSVETRDNLGEQGQHYTIGVGETKTVYITFMLIEQNDPATAEGSIMINLS